jgi:hypothetical protein
MDCHGLTAQARKLFSVWEHCPGGEIRHNIRSTLRSSTAHAGRERGAATDLPAHDTKQDARSRTSVHRVFDQYKDNPT